MIQPGRLPKIGAHQLKRLPNRGGNHLLIGDCIVHVANEERHHRFCRQSGRRALIVVEAQDVLESIAGRSADADHTFFAAVIKQLARVLAQAGRVELDPVELALLKRRLHATMNLIGPGDDYMARSDIVESVVDNDIKTPSADVVHFVSLAVVMRWEGAGICPSKATPTDEPQIRVVARLLTEKDTPRAFKLH
jgi:hypothetical protein